MDRALASGARGRKFESCRARCDGGAVGELRNRKCSSDPKIEPYSPRDRLPGESLVPLVARIKAVPDGVDVTVEHSADLWSSFESFTGSRPDLPDPDHFRIPNYSRGITLDDAMRPAPQT